MTTPRPQARKRCYAETVSVPTVILPTMRIRTTYGPPLPGELAAQLARAIALTEIVGVQHCRADDTSDTGHPTSALIARQ